MRKTVLGVLGILALGSVCNANANWQSPGFNVAFSNVSPTYSMTVVVAPDPNQSVFLNGTWASQDGLVTGGFTEIGSGGGYNLNDTLVPFSSYAAVVSTGSGPWTVNGNTGSQSVQWKFTADWSSIDPSTFATAQAIVPSPGQIIYNPTPTFSWSLPAGKEVGSDPTLAILNSSGQAIIFGSVGSSTTWTVPTNLSPGNYTLTINYQDLNFTSLPITTTLISGTNQSLPTYATVYYQSLDKTSFTIAVPEPALIGLAAVPLLLRRRQARG
ncbi:MAG TPA: hypothetical protein VGG19_11655 [Tepidisphaeraceae bacterium]